MCARALVWCVVCVCDEELGLALGQLAYNASVIDGEVLRLEAGMQARKGAGLRAEALLLREAVTRLEAGALRHADEAALWRDERQALEELVANLRAEVTLLQATSGKAAELQGQARSSISIQAPGTGSQQAPADGVSMSEVRVQSSAVRGQSRITAEEGFQDFWDLSMGEDGRDMVKQ